MAFKANQSEKLSKRKKKSKASRSTEFYCEICSKQLSSFSNFIRHNVKHQPKNYICDYEGRNFNTKDKLRLHILQHRIHYRVQCKVCLKSYTTNQSMRKHLRTHFEHHQCDQCGQTFKHKLLLLNHVSSIHVDEQTIQCNYCTRYFPNKTTRDSHHRAIHRDQQVNTGFFKCPDCPVGFEMREELRIHSFTHFEGEIHTCLDCGQIFKLKKLLTNHAKKHDSAQFVCPICRKPFKYRSNLGKHLRGRCKGPSEAKKETDPSAEEQAEIAKKQLIDMTFIQSKVAFKPDTTSKRSVKEVNNTVEHKSESQEAIANVDVVGKPSIKLQSLGRRLKQQIQTTSNSPITSNLFYNCDLCDFQDLKKSQILSHIRHHISSQRHKCKTCLETFSTKMKLQNHSMKTHGRGVIGSPEYSKAMECPSCKRVFSEERLKFHMKLHESINFTCDQCSKMFRSLLALENHIEKSHSTEKRFTCSTCGKSFKKMTILKHHEEIHNPIKIYVQCEICNTMMQVKSLKLHMAVQHEGRYERKHICECGKSFRYEKQLEKHYKAVHEKVNRGIIYPCNDCSKVFNRRSELRLHSFEHYKGKLFECECGMKFKTKKLLTYHSAVHKDNQLPCEHCTLVFKTRGGRRKHLAKVHGKEFIEIPTFEQSSEN